MVMRVLLIWNGPATATERAILIRREIPFLEQLQLQGVHPTVALMGDRGRMSADLLQAGIDVRVISASMPPSPAAFIGMPAAALQVRRLVRQLRPDIIEATEPMPAIASALFLGPRKNRPVVVYRRQHASGAPRLLLASRLATLLSDRTIVSNEAMRQRAAIDDRRSLDRIEVATSGTAEPLSVSLADVTAARRSLQIDDSALIIGAVSRLRLEKGLDVLIRSLEYLSGVGPLHLFVAGTGPEDERLRELAAASPVRVHFVGHRDDVALWLRVADVIAIPSRRESFGRITLEAMAAGRPIVATNAGGLSEAIIDGETGLLVAPEDPRALAEALRAVLSDRALARRLGDSARARFLSRYTIEHMARSRRKAWNRTMASARMR
jgi:glycosyltransferase involved in cell wall biosynthesis